jgi:hypothetical protein
MKSDTVLCCICQVRPAVTKDHIPPKSFFPEPRANNLELITVPACSLCNNGSSDVDDEFRAFLLCAHGLSEAGELVRDSKLFSSNSRRRRTFKKTQSSLIAKTVVTPWGDARIPCVSFSKANAQRFLFRITRALLHVRYPGACMPDAQFRIIPLTDANRPLAKSKLVANALLSRMTVEAVGSGVFDFGHVLVQGGAASVWAYRFYETVAFMVFHSNTGFEKHE